MSKKVPVADASAAIEWSEVGPADFRARSLFLRLTPGLTHTVRLFHRPLRFWRRPEGRGVAVITEAEARAAGTVASCRYAVNVIDRADRQVKVLEGPEALFIEFRRCHELTGVQPGGNDAFDFGIDVVGVGVARVYRVSYDAERPTPFTAREKDMLKCGMYALTALFPVRPWGISQQAK